MSTPSVERKCLIQHNLAYNRSRGIAAQPVRKTLHLHALSLNYALIGQFPYLLHLKPAQLVAPAEKACQHPKRAGRTNDYSKKCSSHDKVCKPKPYCPVTALSYHSLHTRWRASKDLWIIQNCNQPRQQPGSLHSYWHNQTLTGFQTTANPESTSSQTRRNAFIFSS